MARVSLLLPILVGMALASAATSAVHGQTTGRRYSDPRNPARVPDQPGIPKALKARQVSEAYGRCVVARKPKDALWLATHPVFEVEWGERSTVSECLDSGELRMDRRLMRGSIYQALYLRDFVGAAPTLRKEDPDYASDMPAAAPSLGQYLAERRFAQCVLRAEPARVDALLRASPGSVAEEQAFGWIMIAMKPCLPAGTTFSFGKALLLGWLAEAAYRTSEGSAVS